jgi:hypothetical protein
LQGALGEGVGIAGTDEVLAGLREPDLEIEHIGAQGGAGVESLLDDRDIGFVGIDRCLGGDDELPGLLHREEGAGDFGGDRLADRLGFLARGVAARPGGAFSAVILPPA